ADGRAERARAVSRHAEHPLHAEATGPRAAGAGRGPRPAHPHRHVLRVRAGSVPAGCLAARVGAFTRRPDRVVAQTYQRPGDFNIMFSLILSEPPRWGR